MCGIAWLVFVPVAVGGGGSSGDSGGCGDDAGGGSGAGAGQSCLSLTLRLKSLLSTQFVY